jgi:hypothetical protein
MNSIPDAEQQRLWLSSAIALVIIGSSVLFWDEAFEAVSRINSYVIGANCLLAGTAIWFYRLGLSVPNSTWTMYSSALALVFAGISSLWWQDTLRDVDEWRGLVLLAGIAGGIFTLASTQRSDSTVALREKTALLGLIVTLAIGKYLFDEFGHLTASGYDGSARDVLIATIVMLVVQGIVVGIIESREGAEVLEDERDAAIARRSESIANTTLHYLLIAAIVAMGVFPRGWSGWESSVATAHILIGVLIVADFVGYAATLCLYRFART